MKVVILGGYGNFGARIARALADNPDIDLSVAGRSAAKAQDFAASVGATALALDVRAPKLAEQLAAMNADLVIHTAGPFQQQGYEVARAAAVAGCHYIDLADGRRFVCDFADSLDAEFKRAGRTAITGASTVPALSSAVVDHLRPSFSQIDSIQTCIAPAQQAPRGEATLAGVLSYCGGPINVWKEGAWQEQAGWSAPIPISFMRMKPRLGALCDIPDLELMVTRYAGVNSVMFRAALEVQATQKMFALLAWMKLRGLPVRPASLAAPMHRFGGLLDTLGSQLGGMVVEVCGHDADGQSKRFAWHIAADRNHGPEIPCMPAILLARRLARGECLPAGAQACMGLLTLDEFRPEFERWGMISDLEEGIEGASS